MEEKRYNEDDLKSVEHLLGYFDLQVLASYRNEPHKYAIKSDFFEGEIRVTDEYYEELDNSGNTSDSIDIQFGYRTLKDGNLAIVAWLPDLFNKSKTHIPKWGAFNIKDPQWTTEYDERFDKWVRRYLEGNWGVDNGPIYYLRETVKLINGLTKELVGAALFKHEISETISYPAAENTHRYQDCHKELYGYLIDGIEKDCILSLATRLNKNIKIGDKNTVQSLLKLFPALETTPCFLPAMNLVSEQRRLASHGVRPQAKPLEAFSQYTKDLSLCVEALKELQGLLEADFGVDGKEAYQRNEAKKWLPVITRPPETTYSIVEASQMIGKTIEKVEFGFRKDIKNVHGSEALIVYFTDGSIMGLETGSNAMNLCDDENKLKPEDFQVDIEINWVKGLTKKNNAEEQKRT